MFRNYSTRQRGVAAFALAGVLSVGLVACAGSGDSSPPDTAKGPGTDGPEVQSIMVGQIPADIYVPLYLGVDQGYFADNGLDVALESLGNGPAGITQLISGERQVITTGTQTVVFAAQQGIALSLIAETVNQVPGSGTMTIEALADSGIHDAKDLVGKKVATLALNGYPTILANGALADLGVDYKKIEWVEVAPSELGAALERGTVDAVTAWPPIIQNLKSTLGTITVVDMITKELAGIDRGAYAVSTEWAKKNPKAVAAFQCGLKKGAEAANGDSDLTAQTVIKYTKLPKTIVDSVPQKSRAVYSTKSEAKTYQLMADMMLEQGLIKKPFDFATATIPFPKSCDK